ncbi:MAG: hypothetical protein M3R22_04470 [Pseudomonadota bacterium]|nr:hypothetical protein [Pseudomonadota bacterium]
MCRLLIAAATPLLLLALGGCAVVGSTVKVAGKVAEKTIDIAVPGK